MEGLRQNLDKIEKGLKLFDTGIPTLLSEEIDAVGVDEFERLVIVVCSRHRQPQFVAKEVLRIFYMWNYACDFKDDFFAEAQEQAGVAPVKVPPRIVVLTDEAPSPSFWAYLKHFKDCFIDIDVYRQNEAGTNGGKERFWLKMDWPDKFKPISRAALHRMNDQNAKMALESLKLWEQLSSINPGLRGYDRDRQIEEAKKLGFRVTE